MALQLQYRPPTRPITQECLDDRPVGTRVPYCFSGEVDHCQHCLLCFLSAFLWTPCWSIACCVPGFCPTPCGDEWSCEGRRFVDPTKRLLWKLGKANSVFTVEISPRPQLVAGVITPSPEILRAPVSGMPCVLYHVVAWELVDARSPSAVDCDAPGVLPGEGFDNDGVMASVAHGKECSRACCCTDCCLIWVKRYSEVKSADFYLSDPNFPATTHPNGPQLFVPARGPPAGAGVGSGVGKEGVGADGVIEALDFHALRSDRPRKGNLNIYFSGTELVIPHNITELGDRHGFRHSRLRRRTMRYEERCYCVGDAIALVGAVAKGEDPFGKPVPCMKPMPRQELPDAYYQLQRMTELEKRALVAAQGKILATGDITSLEPPFFGCACFSEWEPCGGCTAFGCSKLC